MPQYFDFNQSFGGGLRNGANLASLFQQRQKRSQLQDIANLVRQGDFQNAGADLIGAGDVNAGVRLGNVPYQREQQRLQQLFQNQQFQATQDFRKAQLDRQNNQFNQNLDFRNRSFDADEANRAAMLDLARQKADATTSGAASFTSPVQAVDEDGNVVFMQTNDRGTAKVVDGFKPNNPIKVINTKDEQVVIDSRTGRESSRTPIQNQRAAFDTEVGKQTGKNSAAARQDLPRIESNAQAMLGVIDGILDHPALDTAVGNFQSRIPDIATSQGVVDFRARAAQLEGKAFLEAFQSLKGGGQITEAEGRKATAAIGRLDQAQSEGAYRSALIELKDIVKRSVSRARRLAGPRLSPNGTNAAREVPSGQTSNGVKWSVE